jgi:hypothetical protein
MTIDPDELQAKLADNPVFNEVQAVLLNSDCDPYEAGVQGLCALFAFVGTELTGSKLAAAVEEALETVFAETMSAETEDDKPKRKPNSKKKRL